MAKQQRPSGKIDVNSTSKPLTDNPFAGLAAKAAELPQGTPVEPSAPPQSAEPAASFRVERTRKGGFPVFLEKRPNGKTVTVVRNLSGNVEDLLARLKRLCGAGGVLREGAIEIQGDHRERVEAFLREHTAK